MKSTLLSLLTLVLSLTGFSQKDSVISFSYSWSSSSVIGDHEKEEVYTFQDETTGKYGYRKSFYCEPMAMWVHEYNGKKGEIVIPAKYDRIDTHPFGLYNETDSDIHRVYQDGLYGLVDPDGVELVPCKYYNMENFSDGLAAVQLTEDGNFGYIDTLGKLVIDLNLDCSAVGEFVNGTTEVYRKESYPQSDGTPIHKYSIIDKTGKVVSSQEYYTPCGALASFEGLQGVMSKDYLWGFVDSTGKEVIPCQYDDIIEVYRNGKAKVSLNGREFYIDHNGNEVEE